MCTQEIKLQVCSTISTSLKKPCSFIPTNPSENAINWFNEIWACLCNSKSRPALAILTFKYPRNSLRNLWIIKILTVYPPQIINLAGVTMVFPCNRDKSYRILLSLRCSENASSLMMSMPLQHNNELVMRLVTLLHRLSSFLWYQEFGSTQFYFFFKCAPR